MVRPLKIALPVLVLAGAFAIAGFLTATRERTEARPAVERVWPVETVPARFEDIRPMLRFYGEVAAGREIEQRAPAAGAVIRVAEAFADGAAVSAGTELMAVDPFDYEQALAERTAARDEARAQLAETRARLSSERELLAEDDEQVAIGARDLARRESLVGAAVSERGLDEQLALARQAGAGFRKLRARLVARRRPFGKRLLVVERVHRQEFGPGAHLGAVRKRLADADRRSGRRRAQFDLPPGRNLAVEPQHRADILEMRRDGLDGPGALCRRAGFGALTGRGEKAGYGESAGEDEDRQGDLQRPDHAASLSRAGWRT